MYTQQTAAMEPRLAIVDVRDWRRYSHEQLYKSVHEKNDPGQVGQLGAEWEKFRSELTEAAREINAAVSASESGWSGAVAETAREGMRKLAAWVTETSESVCKMADQVQEQGRIMSQARSYMPEPKEFDYALATKAFSGDTLSDLMQSADDISNDRDEARTGKQQAVEVMRQMEDESRELDRTTPSFSAPYNPVTASHEGSNGVKFAPDLPAPASGDDATKAAFASGPNDGKANFGSTAGLEPTRDPKAGGFPQMKGSLGGGGGGFGGGGFGGGGLGGFGGGRFGGPTEQQMARGGHATVVPQNQQQAQRGFAPAGGQGQGAPGAAPPPGGAPGAGQGAQDGERKNKYALSEDIFEELGGDLPPPVIGHFEPPAPQKVGVDA